MKNKIIFLLIVCLYTLSLFLPGIISEPTLEDNFKHGFCARATTQDFRCNWKSWSSYNCARADSKLLKNEKISSSEEVTELCGQDWDTPQAKIFKGYEILMMGWLGIFIFNFAWWGNPLFFIALILGLRKKYKDAYYFSVLAFAFGVSAFALFRVPRNEGRVNDHIVDQLGIGYYLWLITLVAFGLHIYMLWRKNEYPGTRYPFKAIFLPLAVTALVFIPTFFVSYSSKDSKKGMEAIVEVMEKKAAEEQKNQADNLMNPFLQTLQKKNYKVTMSENNVAFYLEKGAIVRVGEPQESDSSKKYYILKNNKVYIINAAKKVYMEMDVKSESGKKELERVKATSLLVSILDMEEEIKNLWKRTENKQVVSNNNVSIEAEFNLDTSLMTQLVVKDGGKSALVRSFIYEPITDQDINTAKTFPFEYRKVDSIQ